MKRPPVISIIFVFIFPFLIGLSTLSTPFTLTGDGELVKLASDVTLSNNIKSLNPAHFFSSYLPYRISGPNPVAFHFFHVTTISLTSLLIFLTIFSLTNNNLGAVVGSLGFTFTTSSSKLINNLGSFEPYLILFLIIFFKSLINLYYAQTKKNALFFLSLSLLSLFLAVSTKQESIYLIPGLFLLILATIFIIKKVTRYAQMLAVIALSAVLFVLLNIYSGFKPWLSFDKSILERNLNIMISSVQKDTGWYLPLSLFFFLIILVKKSKDLRHNTSQLKSFCLFFLTVSVSFLIPLSQKPHGDMVFSAAYLPLFIFIGVSLSYLFSIIRRLKKAVQGRLKVLGHFMYTAFIIYSLVFFYFQIKETAKETLSEKEKAVLHSDMVKNLSKNLKDDSIIYFIAKEEGRQYSEETRLHLNLFYNKNNQIQRLNPSLLPPLKGSDLIVVSHQFQEIPDSMINQILSRKTLLYNTYLWTIYKIER